MDILIVEGKDDVAFIEYFIQYLQLDNLDVDKFTVDELGGFSEDALAKKLANILKNAKSKPTEKIGIIIDLDLNSTKGGYKNRLNSVNDAIKKAFLNKDNLPRLPQVNQFVSFNIDDNLTVEIACHFIGVDGKGELEDLLRAIKKIESHHADCLESWRDCLACKHLDAIEKTDKEINKLWVHYYLKYDAFNLYSNSKKPEDKYCKLENIFLNLKNVKDKKEKLFEENVSATLFDFEKTDFKELNELKAFLKLFKNEEIV